MLLESLTSTCCLHELATVFYLILPVSKFQVNVVSQLVNYILGCGWLAYHLYFLALQIAYGGLN